MVNTPACSEAAVPEFPKPTPVESAVPEASITNAEVVAQSVEEAAPKVENMQSNSEATTFATEEQDETKPVTAREDSKEPEAPAQDALVKRQEDLVEDLKEALVEPTAQVPEVATNEQPVIAETLPAEPAVEESFAIGDVVDGVLVSPQNISEPKREEALSDGLKSMSVEATTEDVREEQGVVAAAMEEKPVYLTVDEAIQNDYLSENQVIAHSEPVQAKVQANHAGPSLSSQHLPGGSVCVKFDPLLSKQEPLLTFAHFSALLHTSAQVWHYVNPF